MVGSKAACKEGRCTSALMTCTTTIACSDGLCAEEDSCPLDTNNDVDKDGVCGDVDT